MKNSTLLLALVLGAGFTAGILHLFGVQFAAGDVYPEYSSLRADALGTRLLFESLADLPGITPLRNYLPLESFGEAHDTVLLLGIKSQAFSDNSGTLEQIEQLARRGNRVVAAMNEDGPVESESLAALDRKWHVRLGTDSSKKHVHTLYFAEAKDWNVLDRAPGKLLAIERDFGKGSVVLFAESGDFSNESTISSDRLEIVTAALGASPRIVFDESHLGIAESGSIVGLARRFHLTGLAWALALCAALFIWRNASSFPPAREKRDVVAASGRTSLSGLVTLLRRHIAPRDLTAACWQEWLSANRRGISPERLQAASAIASAARDRPLEAMRELETVLHSKGSS